MEASKSSSSEKARSFVLWLCLPLLAGILIAALIPYPPQAAVGIIYLNDSIYSGSAAKLMEQIDYARDHPEIRAVVLALDSPGGVVTDTEAVYLDLLKLRRTKPVVVSIGSMAASGAYYLTVSADYVFALPTSDVGNIGVIGYLPSAPTIYEGIISTGPYKLFGWPRDTYTRQIEMIKQGFYAAVKAGRGDRLTASADVVLSGQLWPGSQALRMGLIDALGGKSDAVEKAAQMVGLQNYKTIDLSTFSPTQTPGPKAAFFAQTTEGVSLPYPQEAGIYLLYIPPQPVQEQK